MKKIITALDLSKTQIVFVSILIFLAVAMSVFVVINFLHSETHTNCVVNDKTATSSRDGDNTKYRVYTDNCGTFSIEDSVLTMKFNSSDIYGSIQEGGSYDFETRGYRIPLMSNFPNINEAVKK